MYIGASLFRQVPIVLLIVLIMEMINQYRYINEMNVLINISVKVLFAYVIGIYIGHLEWNFLDKIFSGSFSKDIEFRLEYTFTYGICMFGTAIASGSINLYFMSIKRIIYSLFLYVITSVIWGILVSYSVSRNILKEQGQ